MKKISLISRKFDLLDLAAVLIAAVAGSFVAGFLWQASAGATASEEAFYEQIRLRSEKRILKERSRLGPILATGPEEGILWDRIAGNYARLEGNSQFHLLLADGYRERGELPEAVREYRRAVEANRDYTDRRSDFYIGERLRPFVREAKAAYVTAGVFARPAGPEGGLVRDVFFLERSLAGGCH